MALEAEFWAALGRLAAGRAQSVSGLVAEVDAARTPGRPLASALRVLALREAPREASPSNAEALPEPELETGMP